jgi:hypothetical protein
MIRKFFAIAATVYAIGFLLQSGEHWMYLARIASQNFEIFSIFWTNFYYFVGAILCIRYIMKYLKDF